MLKPLEVFRQKTHTYRQAYATTRQKGRVLFQQKKQNAEQLYQRYEKYVPLAAFISGFAWDSLTLTRIDSRLDNFILLAYTLAAGILIAVIGLIERGRLRQSRLVTRLHWITGITHFFLGGLLSSYVVFYFKSAGVGKSFIFIGLLVGLMLANEFFAARLRNLKLLCAVYFFCCFAFLTFFLPVMTHKMNALMFICSGLLSFVVTGAIVAVIYFGGIQQARRELLDMAWPPVVIFLALVLFYFLNWIPPVPLALKSGGIYRTVKKVGTQYAVRYSQPRWWQVWRNDDRHFAYAPGDTVYCFTAIFSPTGFANQFIVYDWQRKNAAGDWISTEPNPHKTAIKEGGRDGGWRSYSFKKNITPGKWRIEVKTAEEQRLLGRIPLEVIQVETPPQKMKIDYR
ncbi:MAG: hypothetical protein ALAOOOJD_03642 [bacterium]|nr:hypothetical protein [bacterium]